MSKSNYLKQEAESIFLEFLKYFFQKMLKQWRACNKFPPKYIRYNSFVCMCACGHGDTNSSGCICILMFLHLCAHVCRGQSSTLGAVFKEFSCYFLRQGLSLALSSPIRPDWLPGHWIISMCPACTRVLEGDLRFSWLHGKHFTNWVFALAYSMQFWSSL